MPEFKIPFGKNRLIYFCFFLSGATALVYQVLWARYLGLILGNTMYAISMVLAAFMAGLGLGTYLVGKLLERYSQPLSVYAILELGIGLWALFVPVLLDNVDHLHSIIHPVFEFSILLDAMLHFGLSSLVLLVPTILMGGSLPALTTCCTEGLPQLGGRLSLLYALNTLGAALGTWWVGFYALPNLGMSTTNIIAALINIAIGITFLSPKLFTTKNPAKVIKSGRIIPDDKKTSYFLMGGICVAGFSAMIYEIAWTRTLILVLGSSTYAFSCILMVFLLGIALGSFIYNQLLKRITFGMAGFCLIQILIGAFSLISLPAFSLLPRIYLILYNLLPSNISWAIQIIRFVIPMTILIIPTTLMGLVFPLAAKLYSQETEEVTVCVCQIYGFNTLGDVIGAFLTGFFFLSILGAQNTLKMAIIMNLLTGIVGIWLLLEKSKITQGLSMAALFIIGLALLQPQWDKYLLNRGVSVYAKAINPMLPIENSSKDEILYYKEGLNDVVSVYQDPEGQRALKINGKTDASNSPIDMSTQLLLGYIPLFMHHNPQNAFVIGLGSGVTVRTLAQYDFIREVDCVEIEPAVVEAANYFNPENGNIFQNPKVNIIIEDARWYMRSKPKVYDLIVSEPSNPWIKGVGNLYTTDFYRSCLRQLTSGGIMCQWLQTYELSQETLKMAINSFRTVFPYCQLWFNPPSNAMILGSKQPFVFNFTRIESLINYNDFIKQEIKRILDIDIPLDCLVYFELNNSEMTQLTQGASVNTDDYPRLEFFAPYNLTMNTVIPNHDMIKSYKREVLPPNIKLADTKKIFPEDYYYRLSQVYLKVGLDRRINQYIHWAYESVDTALKMNGQDARFYVVRGRINTAREGFLEAEKDFNRSLELDPLNYEPYLELAYLFEKQKKLAEAQSYYQQALKRAPQNSKIHIDYANFLDSKEKQQLFQSMDRELYLPKEP